MSTSIKIIKRKPNDNPNESGTGKTEKTVERSTREMVSTVKSWIEELQQKRRSEPHSFQAIRLVNIGHGSSVLAGPETEL